MEACSFCLWMLWIKGGKSTARNHCVKLKSVLPDIILLFLWQKSEFSLICRKSDVSIQSS